MTLTIGPGLRRRGSPLLTRLAAALWAGGLIIAIGFGSLLCNALAVKYGKWPIYLLTTIGLMFTCFWAAATKSYTSLVAARVIQGFCMGPLEALVPASIADVWFVHERGLRTSIFNLGVLGGINLAQPIAGAIIQYGSCKIAFNAMGGAFGLALVLMFFWMPEVAFVHVGAINLDAGSNSDLTELNTTSSQDDKHLGDREDMTLPEADNASIPTSQETPYSFAREILPYAGYINHVFFWNTLFRSFAMLGLPAVMWVIFFFTTCISWLVGISIIFSQIFSAPLYNFSVTAVGLTNISSFVASLLGTVVSGPLIDGIVRKMSLRNGGTFEPEFRLPIMMTYLLFTATGFFAWGQSAYAHNPWPVPVIVGLGFINFGIQLGTTGVISYVVDCHREKSSESFAVINFIKNLFSFGLANYLNDWVAVQRTRNVFFVMGGITIGVSLLTIPMYVYGKKARSWTHRHNITGRA